MSGNRFTFGALLVGILCGCPALAVAQTYPSKPIRIVVPLPPGGPPDAVARAISQVLQRRIGQNVIIENRPGAGTTTATMSVAAAPPDGYTLLFNGSDLLYFPVLYPKLDFDPSKKLSVNEGPAIF